jgi:hypothetical protein
MWPKALAWFQARTQHLDYSSNRAKFRPSQSDWLSFRMVVQFWFRVMRQCCEKDMTAADYKDHMETVMLGSGMDSEITNMLARNIRYFHIGMLSTQTAQMCAETLANNGAVQKSILDAAKANLEVLKIQLKADWANIVQLRAGKNALADLLAWLEATHRREQAALGQANTKLTIESFASMHAMICQELVQQYVDKSFKFISSQKQSTIDCLQGDIRKVYSDFGLVHKNPYIVVWIDFNVPYSRDPVKLQKVISTIAYCLAFNKHRAVCMMWLPDIAKSPDTPLFQELSSLVQMIQSQGMDSTTDIVCNIRTFCAQPAEHVLNSTPSNYWNWQA